MHTGLVLRAINHQVPEASYIYVYNTITQQHATVLNGRNPHNDNVSNYVQWRYFY